MAMKADLKARVYAHNLHRNYQCNLNLRTVGKWFFVLNLTIVSWYQDRIPKYLYIVLFNTRFCFQSGCATDAWHVKGKMLPLL